MKEVAVKYPGLQHQPGNGKSWGRVRQAIRNFLRAQFGRPTGICGTIVGTIMANASSNQVRIRWTIAQLDLKPNDRVLEIGFGPGFAVKEVCKLLPDGFIAGVDHSEVMVRQAKKRNAVTVRNGKVDLRLGSVSELPTYNEPFDKIFTINSIHFWIDPKARLKELRELLRPGGLIVVTLQPRSRGSTNETTDTIGRELVINLEHAGFKNVRLEIKPANPAPIACVLGIR
jgi:ubiquinone/menaquinone biosynthesis C-methylase UbiE